MHKANITPSVMDRPLNVISLLEHAAKVYPRKEVISRRISGDIHRSNYKTVYQRASQLAHALTELGIKADDCIASLAWNSDRHMELYYAVTGIGAIMHTVNPRLFIEQISYILNHAEDTWLFVDIGFEAIVDQVISQCPSIKGVFFLTDNAHVPACNAPYILDYESLIAGQPQEFSWPVLEEEQPCMLCYTSGTTGDPKGVLYSHREMVLHAWSSISAETLDIRPDSVILPMVAMYHAQAWGLPFAAPIVGAKLVFPGNGMDGESIFYLLESERVDLAFGVPTIWQILHQHLVHIKKKPSTLKRVCVGGAASPMHLVKLYHQAYGIYWQPLWGMTETGPLVTSGLFPRYNKALTDDQRYALQTSAGRPICGVEIEIFDEQGQPVAHDGVSSGELRVLGPYIIKQYYKSDDLSAFPDGWLATGDIATIDAEQSLHIVDRMKDVIKSGGEWISSLELENITCQHPNVEEACVIGCQHPKWDERPVLLVKWNDKAPFTDDTLYQFLTGKIAKWWTPDAIIQVDELPKNGTGKVMKAALRQQYHNLLSENSHA